MAPARRKKRPLTAITPAALKPAAPNPFQQRWAQSKATAARRQLKASQSKNTIIDKRIAEHDPNITDAERYLLRLQRERTRKNKQAARFNLNDHDDYNNDDPDKLLSAMRSTTDNPVNELEEEQLEEEDEDEEELFTLKENNEEEDDGDDNEGNAVHKTKQEVMSEVMQKSKEYKAQRQQEKHHTDEQTAKLDTGLQQIMQLLQYAETDKEKQLKQEQQEKEKYPSSFLTASLTDDKDAAAQKEKLKKSNDLEYDSVYNMLAAEKRARPTNRLLTEEEAAAMEREKLIEMENLRKKRMNEIDDDHQGHQKGKSKSKKRVGADDLVDSFHDDSMANEANQSDSDDDNDNATDKNDDDDDDDMDTSLKDKKGKEKSDHQQDEDVESKELSIGTASSFWKSFKVENVVAKTDKDDENLAEVPYLFSTCPKTANELQELFTNTTIEQRNTILERLRKCFALSLDPGRNRRRLERLVECLMFRVERLCEIGGTSLEVAAQETDMLLKHIHALASTYQKRIGLWARTKVFECSDQLTKEMKVNDMNTSNDGGRTPYYGLCEVWSFKHILLLRSIARLFPSSDLRHSVITPLALLLSEALNVDRMISVADIGFGIFIAYVLMEATGGRCGYSPELASFICFVISCTYGISPDEWTEETDLRYVFSQVEAKDDVGKLKLSDCESLLNPNESLIRRIAPKIINSTISLMQVWFKNWIPHVDIVLANINCGRILADSVHERVKAIIESGSNQEDGKTHRKPLTLYSKKKERTIVKVLNPRMHCEENGVFHKRGRSRFGGPSNVEEAAAAAKRVKRALRKAERGQTREIRTEAAANAHEQLQQDSNKRKRADKRDKEVRAFFEHQRSTWREAEKKQHKLAGKRW